MFDYLPSTILDLHLITAMAGGWYLCLAVPSIAPLANGGSDHEFSRSQPSTYR